MKEKIFNWGLLILNLLGIALNIYVFNPFLLTLSLAGATLTLVVLADIYNLKYKSLIKKENNYGK